MNTSDSPILPMNIFLRSSEYTYTSDTNKNNLFFELNTPVLCYDNMNILIKLNSFKFTNSFYTVNDNNNIFYYKFISGVINKVVLTKGNYDIDTFLNYLTTVTPFTFTFNNSTLKISISYNQVFAIVAYYNNCNELIGFDTENDTDYNLIQQAPYMCNLSGIQVLNICLGNVNLNSVGVKNKTKYNILDSIHIDVEKGQNQTYYNNHIFHYKLSESLITYFNIIIYDQDFNIIDFNNIDWFLNLCVSFQYKSPLNIPETLIKYHENNMIQDTQDEEQQSASEALLQEEQAIINNYNN